MKIKIACACSDPLLKLAVQHLQDYFTGHEIEIVFFDEEQSLDLISAVGQIPDLSVVRMDLDFSRDWVSRSPLMPLSVSRFQAADCFFKTTRGWEPDLIFERAFHDVIVRMGRTLDLTSAAYVIGKGALLRVVAGVALGLGYQHVAVVGETEEDVEAQAAVLRRVFVGATIENLPAHALTLQTIGASLLINTMDLTERAELASDLAYFNFMKRGGLVIDLPAALKVDTMLEEAMSADLRVLPPHEISGACEVHFARRLGLKVDSVAYVNSWFEFLKNEGAVETAEGRR